MTSDILFSRPADLNDIGAQPLIRAISASEQERCAIAKALDLSDLTALKGDLVVTRRVNSGGVDVTGVVHADYAQSCVVTLENLQMSFQQNIAVTYLPDHEMPQMHADEHGDLIFELDEDDPPELMEGSIIDLGQIVLDELSLSIDPFPRKTGAKLSKEYEAELQFDRANPFAVLESLKK